MRLDLGSPPFRVPLYRQNEPLGTRHRDRLDRAIGASASATSSGASRSMPWPCNELTSRSKAPSKRRANTPPARSRTCMARIVSLGIGIASCPNGDPAAPPPPGGGRGAFRPWPHSPPECPGKGRARAPLRQCTPEPRAASSRRDAHPPGRPAAGCRRHRSSGRYSRGCRSATARRAWHTNRLKAARYRAPAR